MLELYFWTNKRKPVKEIRKIIATYDQLDLTEEKVALAAVVNVEESSYRRIGARMLVRSNGLWTGGISGGCLEGDALKRSQMAIFKGEASKVVYDTMDDDNNQIGVGLGCNGRIEVVFTPIDAADPNNEIEQLKKIATAEVPSVMLKIIDAPPGSQLLGQKRLVEQDTPAIDFVGIDPLVLQESVAATWEQRRARIIQTQAEGGAVTLLVEFIRPETRLIVVGDNYDVSAMLGVANELGWECYVVGKAKKLTKEIYQLAREVVDFAQADTLPVHDYTAVLLMSHDYNRDKQMLPIFANQHPRYLGMLGPRKRFQNMQNDLKEMNLASLPFFYSPTGLEIGAESPHEIALSIAAEIIAVFRQKKGGFLKDKEGAIHERAGQVSKGNIPAK
ncbi:MAG: XshC-Cox1 family protein [Bacteroidetes bacterium]|nr:MAG: XshC-Cox1 family protein [Bacteroidota bacterium]PTM12968.1 MAG: XshC-Cox1 family protein [Bacteroidota bacterium]